MQPLIPFDEPARLAAVQALGLLDTPAEERFDRLTRLAVRMFDVPVALVTLVDADRQFFKSAQGIEGFETPREISFCTHAIAHPSARADVAHPSQAVPLVVPDSLLDPRFATNVLVTGAPHVRFYAGVPLRAKNGQPVGSFCIIDRSRSLRVTTSASASSTLVSTVASTVASTSATSSSASSTVSGCAVSTAACPPSSPQPTEHATHQPKTRPKLTARMAPPKAAILTQENNDRKGTI